MKNPITAAQAADATNVRAIILMVAAMGFFALEDVLIKLTAQTISSGQILFVLSLIGASGFAIICARDGRKLIEWSMWSRPMLWRLFGELIGTFCFVTAIIQTPLASASAILQATPLVVTMGAALVMKEQVGWRRWTAILVGFIGVLLIIRSGTSAFDPLSLFAVGGVIGLAIRDVATRALPLNTSSAQVGFATYSMLVTPAALLMVLQGGWTPFNQFAAITMGTAGLIGIVGYYVVIVAMRIGEISAIAPFRYSRLVFALILAMVVFNERPDAMTLLGAAIVIATGLFTLYREQKAKRRARHA